MDQTQNSYSILYIFVIKLAAGNKDIIIAGFDAHAYNLRFLGSEAKGSQI